MTERERKSENRKRAIARCTEVHGDKGVYIVNSLYRLCVLCEEIARLDNSEIWCNSHYLESLYVRRENWVIRLNSILSKKGERIIFCSYLPKVVNSKMQDCYYRYY